VPSAGRGAAVRSGRPAGWWRDPVAGCFGAVVAVGVAQAATGAGVGPLRGAVPYAVAGSVALAGRWSGVASDDGPGLRWLRVIAGVLATLGAWALISFLLALPSGVGEPSGFYRIKVLVTTPLGDHNTAAGLLLVGVGASVVLAERDRRWWLAVVLTTVGVVACLSRGAAVVLLCAGLLGFVTRVDRRAARSVAVAGVVALIGITGLAVLLDASPPPGAAEAVGPVGASVVGRIDLAARGIDTFLDRPVLGVGLGSFAEVSDDLPPPNDHAHNTFAHAGAEGGVVALTAVVLVTAILAVRGLRAPDGWRRDVAILGGVALVAHGQIDVLGGLVGHEVLLSFLATVTAPGVWASTCELRSVGSEHTESEGPEAAW
jgi:O-antigen ligase